MELKDIKAVYFIGAGGIGMSAIARYFIHRGVVVAGYDRTPSTLTKQLEKEGMLIHYDENIDEIPHACRDKATCLVVYTPAIPAAHKELVWFRDNGFEIQKRAQVLGILTRTHKGLCVAGTHGKTTTSTMCAHIMHQSHVDCNAFLGGISKNYGTNYILSDTSDYVVIEADEFDRSFHWLRPWMTVITATDPDHLDIYGTKEAYLESFRHYTELIQPGGALIIHTDLEMQPNVQEGVKTYTYSRDKGDFHAENIKIENGEITFDFISPKGNITGVKLGQPVPINIENGVAAMAMAQLNGCTDEEIKYGMETYHGVERRFDFKIRNDKHVLLSDYGHHPKEILQSAKSLRELYEERKPLYEKALEVLTKAQATSAWTLWLWLIFGGLFSSLIFKEGEVFSLMDRIGTYTFILLGIQSLIELSAGYCYSVEQAKAKKSASEEKEEPGNK